jgi:hypothetical protein
VARVTRDYFDPAFPTGVAATVPTAAAPCAADPWCIGVFTDNELRSEPEPRAGAALPRCLSAAAAGRAGKVAAQAFLARATAATSPPSTPSGAPRSGRFDDFPVAERAGAGAGGGPPAVRPASPAQIADRRAFDAVVAARFHQVTHDALRALSPDLLISAAGC